MQLDFSSILVLRHIQIIECEFRALVQGQDLTLRFQISCDDRRCTLPIRNFVYLNVGCMVRVRQNTRHTSVKVIALLRHNTAS